MSQPILPSLQEHGEGTVEPLADPPDVHAELALPEAATAPVTLPVDRSRLGLVMALVGLGLLLQGTADTLGRDGHQSRAVLIFLVGITLHFAACAWRLLSRNTSRSERISVSLVLGLGLFASYAMLETPFLDSYDELIHWGTLIHLLDSHALFPANTELPVSPYYPGLELATAATRWITGLPLVVDELIVLALVRILVVLGVYLVIERLCRSSRAGGVAVLVYAASPQFYSFDAQYAYETIALAFAVGTVYLLFFSIDSPRPRARRGVRAGTRFRRCGRHKPPRHRMAHHRVSGRVVHRAVLHVSPASSRQSRSDAIIGPGLRAADGIFARGLRAAERAIVRGLRRADRAIARRLRAGHGQICSVSSLIEEASGRSRRPNLRAGGI